MNERSSSPLRHLDISDDATARDIAAEKARELSAAYERIEDLQAALKGLLGLIRTISTRGDISITARETLIVDHRVTDARELLR